MASVTPIRLSYNTAYLVDAAGERILIDTGPDYDGATAILTDALEGREPSLVVATHGHLDHAGLGKWWQQRGVKVVVHAGDGHLIRKPHFTDPGEFEAFVDYVATSGAGMELQRKLVRELRVRSEWGKRAAIEKTHRPARRADRWPTALLYGPYEPDVTFEAREGPLAAGVTAVHCPGHTPGNIVLAHAGLLFSGDQLLPDITPTPGIQFVAGADGRWERFPSLPRFVDSLRTVRGMGFDRCYPGHGEPFEGVGEVIEQNLAQIEQRTERVLNELRARPATVHELGERIYPRALARRWWQIVATLQGHLDVLTERGLTRADRGEWAAVT